MNSEEEAATKSKTRANERDNENERGKENSLQDTTESVQLD